MKFSFFKYKTHNECYTLGFAYTKSDSTNRLQKSCSFFTLHLIWLHFTVQIYHTQSWVCHVGKTYDSSADKENHNVSFGNFSKKE